MINEDIISRKEAIEVLKKIKAQKEKCECSRQRLREATAIGYAIGVIQKLPAYREK